MDYISNRINCSTKNLLIRPSSANHDRHRCISGISAILQLRHNCINSLDRQENTHRCLMLCQHREFFLFRHRRTAFHTRNNNCLGNIRKRIFLFESCRCCQKGTHPGDHFHLFFCHACRTQPIHLFLNSTINSRIPRMYTCYCFPFMHRF